MFTVEAIRNFYLEQLQKGLQIVSNILKTTSDLTTYRDGGTGWTVQEVIGHLRDFEAVFYERACLTIDQEMPDLPFPSPDKKAEEGRYNQQDVTAMVEAWAAQRKTFIDYLKRLDTAAWNREAKHPVRGIMSLQDQIMLMTVHDANHIEQMTRILAERKTS